MLTPGIPRAFRGGVHLFIPPTVIGSVPSTVYEVPQLRTDGVQLPGVRRHRARASSPQEKRVLPFQGSPWTNCCASLFSHTHYFVVDITKILRQDVYPYECTYVVENYQLPLYRVVPVETRTRLSPICNHIIRRSLCSNWVR